MGFTDHHLLGKPLAGPNVSFYPLAWKKRALIRDREDSFRDNNKCRDLHQYLYLYVVCLDFIFTQRQKLPRLLCVSYLSRIFFIRATHRSTYSLQLLANGALFGLLSVRLLLQGVMEPMRWIIVVRLDRLVYGEEVSQIS